MPMKTIRRVVPNIVTDRLDESRAFYTDILGFRVVMDMGWVVTLCSPDNPTAQISLMPGEREDLSGTAMTVTVEVGSVNDVYAEAVAHGHPIVYPLTDEPWGVRRFCVESPGGVVINVMSHLPG